MGLSVLSRGTVDEKLRWTFNLYDINRDGFITKEEMRDVVTAVYELMGSCAEPNFEESVVNDRVERIFMVSLFTLGRAKSEDFLKNGVFDFSSFSNFRKTGFRLIGVRKPVFHSAQNRF